MVTETNASYIPGCGTRICNTATVKATNMLSPKSDTVCVNEIGNTNLCIEKTADKSTVFIGTDLAYTITIKNIGRYIAKDVMFSDEIPSQLQYKSSTPDSLVYNPINRILSGNLGDIPVGGKIIVMIYTKVVG